MVILKAALLCCGLKDHSEYPDLTLSDPSPPSKTWGFSNCLDFGQAVWIFGFQGWWFLSIELRITISLRMQATSAVFFALPRVNRR